MEPGSMLVCSGFCSLTVKSPVEVDHLVTFIACEIVTWRPAYGNFRKSSERISTWASLDRLALDGRIAIRTGCSGTPRKSFDAPDARSNFEPILQSVRDLNEPGGG
jgi:hypothetical protein